MIGFNVTGAVPDRRYNVQIAFTGFTTISYFVQLISNCASTPQPPTTTPPPTTPYVPPPLSNPTHRFFSCYASPLTTLADVTYGPNTVAINMTAKSFALFHPQAACFSGACLGNVTVLKPVACTTATCTVSLDVLAHIPAGSGYLLKYSTNASGGTSHKRTSQAGDS